MRDGSSIGGLSGSKKSTGNQTWYLGLYITHQTWVSDFEQSLCPSFEEVEAEYCFGLICDSVTLFDACHIL